MIIPVSGDGFKSYRYVIKIIDKLIKNYKKAIILISLVKKLEKTKKIEFTKERSCAGSSL